jgi:hypothetical protein
MLGFASCSETKKVDEAAPFIEQMKSQLEAGDVEELQSTMDNAMAKVSELAETDPEAAKTAFAEIQNFIKESKEKLIAVGAEESALDELISTPANVIVNALTASQSVIDNAEATADSAAQAVQNGLEQAAQNQVTTVEDAVNEQVDAAKQKANDEVNAAKQKANDEVNKAAQKANEEINKAAGDALKSLGL